jgi:YVTN family beta-propeller protein
MIWGGRSLENLYVCNTFSDNISIVDTELFNEDCKISLKNSDYTRIGPHGICFYKNKVLTANNFSNSLSLIDLYKKTQIDDYFIGMHCNDVKVIEDNAVVICGDSNSIVDFNLEENRVDGEIPCGNLPHSIDICKNSKLIVTAEMISDSITLADYTDLSNVKSIRVGKFPTKAIFSIDDEIIYVCESNIGSDKHGSISMFSYSDLKLIKRINVGNAPVDMYVDKNHCFVSNFGDGTVSIIDIKQFKEIKRIYVGGMPRGIVRKGEYIYVGDNYNNLLIKINLLKEEKKAISIGGEPNGMMLL